MTVITIASVGYKEIHDLSPNGRIFTIILIISGVGSVTFALYYNRKDCSRGRNPRNIREEEIGKKRLKN